MRRIIIITHSGLSFGRFQDVEMHPYHFKEDYAKTANVLTADAIAINKNEELMRQQIRLKKGFQKGRFQRGKFSKK